MINTLLLSSNGMYVSADGKLPSRDSIPYDKELLKSFCKNQVVSEKGFNMLPLSIRKTIKKQKDEEITIGITIQEIAKYSDVLLINRSSEYLPDGKIFRLDNFRCLTKQNHLEIWVKK